MHKLRELASNSALAVLVIAASIETFSANIYPPKVVTCSSIVQAAPVIPDQLSQSKRLLEAFIDQYSLRIKSAQPIETHPQFLFFDRVSNMESAARENMIARIQGIRKDLENGSGMSVIARSVTGDKIEEVAKKHAALAPIIAREYLEVNPYTIVRRLHQSYWAEARDWNFPVLLDAIAMMPTPGWFYFSADNFRIVEGGLPDIQALADHILYYNWELQEPVWLFFLRLERF